jgi:hypothetical protein
MDNEKWRALEQPATHFELDSLQRERSEDRIMATGYDKPSICSECHRGITHEYVDFSPILPAQAHIGKCEASVREVARAAYARSWGLAPLDGPFCVCAVGTSWTPKMREGHCDEALYGNYVPEHMRCVGLPHRLFDHRRGWWVRPGSPLTRYTPPHTLVLTADPYPERALPQTTLLSLEGHELLVFVYRDWTIHHPVVGGAPRSIHHLIVPARYPASHRRAS